MDPPAVPPLEIEFPDPPDPAEEAARAARDEEVRQRLGKFPRWGLPRRTARYLGAALEFGCSAVMYVAVKGALIALTPVLFLLEAGQRLQGPGPRNRSL